MPESIIRILSTRPLEPLLLREAARQGVALDTLSFIETHPVADPVLGSRIRELARRPLTAIFTSMNAVEAVAGWLEMGRPSDDRKPEAPPKRDPLPWKIFCIGFATRQLVQQHFGEDALAGTADSALALAESIIGQWPDRPDATDDMGLAARLFFFCGDQRRDELPEALAAASIPVQELMVYRTVQTPHKLEKDYDGIAFFSPSAVHSFFSVNTALPDTTLLFAIGRATATAIRSYTELRTVTGQTPEKDALIQTAIDHLKNNTRREPENHL